MLRKTTIEKFISDLYFDVPADLRPSNFTDFCQYFRDDPSLVETLKEHWGYNSFVTNLKTLGEQQKIAFFKRLPAKQAFSSGLGKFCSLPRSERLSIDDQYRIVDENEFELMYAEENTFYVDTKYDNKDPRELDFN